MSSLADRLSRLLEQLEFEPLGGARFRGRWCNVDEGVDADQETRHLAAQQWLSDHIYMEWHCGIPESSLRRTQVTDPVATRDFVRSLMAANATSRSWEAGWIVAAVEDGRVVAAARHGVRFFLPADGVRAAGEVASGATCFVQLDGEQRNMLPGFHLALGEATPNVAPENQVRVYWHLRSSGAAPLLSAVSHRLNAAGVPYWLKLLSNPSDYMRTDAGVLYLARKDVQAAAPLVKEAYSEVRQHIRPRTSPFALTIAPGLAVAPDLPRSASFGQHRSRLLATTIVHVANDPVRRGASPEVDHVLEMLHAQGMDPSAPYRHRDDADPDSWKAWEAHSRAAVAVYGGPSGQSLPAANDAMNTLEIAGEIADWICDEAFVHDGMWNWMGADVSIDDDDDELHMVYRALGPSMYDGTAGIALFLAEASVATGQTRFADAARGAMRFALARTADMPADTKRGFHTGIAGIAWVASRLGAILDDRTLVGQACELALKLAREESPPLLDVISGAAGTAVALLSLADDLSLEELRSAAGRLGEAICAGATRNDRGWSWGANASGQEFARDLTGFAHGAGGIGWALLELGVATGNKEFTAGAREAMRYENGWYAPDEENWPDFRESDGTELPAPSMMAWCHGAPGIMLSRLRAYQLLGDLDARADLERGMRSSVRWLADPEVQAETSFTLCHGQLGAAECLLHAADVLENETARAVALAVSSRGRALHTGNPAGWSPGLRRGRNPSLMLGQAGIGLAYLRLTVPDVPSVLLWNPRPSRQAPSVRSAARASRT